MDQINTKHCAFSRHARPTPPTLLICCRIEGKLSAIGEGNDHFRAFI